VQALCLQSDRRSNVETDKDGERKHTVAQIATEFGEPTDDRPASGQGGRLTQRLA